MRKLELLGTTYISHAYLSYFNRGCSDMLSKEEIRELEEWRSELIGDGKYLTFAILEPNCGGVCIDTRVLPADCAKVQVWKHS